MKTRTTSILTFLFVRFSSDDVGTQGAIWGERGNWTFTEIQNFRKMSLVYTGGFPVTKSNQTSLMRSVSIVCTISRPPFSTLRVHRDCSVFAGGLAIRLSYLFCASAGPLSQSAHEITCGVLPVRGCSAMSG